MQDQAFGVMVVAMSLGPVLVTAVVVLVWMVVEDIKLAREQRAYRAKWGKR